MCPIYGPGKTKETKERSLKESSSFLRVTHYRRLSDGKTLCPADWHRAEHSLRVGSGLGKPHF